MLRNRQFEKRNSQDADVMMWSQFPDSATPGVPPTGDSGGGDDHNGDGNEACALVAVNLSAYQDDELDPDQQQVVEAHLSHCPKCAALLANIRETDTLIEREWRENAPLPSSLEHRNAIDAIMDALPAAPAVEPTFAPKRVHSKARWVRFSTGLTGLLALLGSSYCLGYVHGRTSRFTSSTPMSGVGPGMLTATSVMPRIYSASYVSSSPNDAPRSPLQPQSLSPGNTSLAPHGLDQP